MKLSQEFAMKLIALCTLFALTACAQYDADLQDHLAAERDFHSHQAYLAGIYSEYDAEYIDDCFAYTELVCEFE
jgi:hypothetical protein